MKNNLVRNMLMAPSRCLDEISELFLGGAIKCLAHPITAYREIKKLRGTA